MAYAEGTNVITELAGDFQLVLTEITPDAATGSVTIGEYDNAIPLSLVFTDQDLASTCIAGQAAQNDSTSNQIDIKLWGTDGNAASAFKKFRLLLLCNND